MERPHRQAAWRAATAFVAMALLGLSWTTVRAQEPAEAAAAPAEAKPLQWIYVVRLVPRLHDDKAWTDADGATIGRHLQYLKDATAAGRVIFGGRTMEPGDSTFGLVVFESRSEGEARDFMNGDPAVAAGLMTASLHPFRVVMQRAP